MILRARWVLPINAPPIENGAVAIDHGRISAVEPAGKLTGHVRDLGEAVLLPGLINAHCHLDYTDLRGRVPWTGNFIDWILHLVALKKQWTDPDYIGSIHHGCTQLLQSGTTTVINIACFPSLIARLEAAPVEVVWCPELIDLTWSEESLRALETALANPHVGGLSPHALYTVSSQLYRLAARSARERGLLLTTHLAESLEEDQMWRHARGPMFERYQRGATHGAVRELDGLGVLAANCLVAHANFITADEAALLAQSGTSVVHCPRTHRFFQRPPAPLELWRNAGVNLCLGTDSLASNETLDMLAEMRELARAWPALAPREILQMATINGARALNRTAELGIITRGARANLIAVPAASATDPFEAVLSARAVSFVMINGKVVRE